MRKRHTLFGKFLPFPSIKYFFRPGITAVRILLPSLCAALQAQKLGKNSFEALKGRINMRKAKKNDYI